MPYSDSMTIYEVTSLAKGRLQGEIGPTRCRGDAPLTFYNIQVG